MTPDKIFIDEDLIAYHCLTDRHDGDIEYIRKDALLEWLKMKTETAEIVVANSVDRWVTRQVYKQVIDKLEAM